MARKYTGEELIAIVRSRGGFNDSATEGTLDADILNVLNEEAHTTLYEVVQRAREEFYVTRERITLVAGTTKYRIPKRAMHNRLRDVIYIDSQGNRRDLVPIPVENQSNFRVINNSEPIGYSLEGNYIAMIPLDNTSLNGTLEILYFLRPNDLVLSTDCGQIATVDLGTGICTSAVYPATWTTGTRFDIHSSSSGAELKAWDLTASAVSGVSITFTAAHVNGSVTGRLPVEVGDWVCVAETAALPGLPRELHPVLAQAAVCRMLESSDPERFPQATQDLQASIQRSYTLFSKRDESEDRVIPIFNSPHLSGIIRRSWWGKGVSY